MTLVNSVLKSVNRGRWLQGNARWLITFEFTTVRCAILFFKYDDLDMNHIEPNWKSTDNTSWVAKG